MSTLLYTKKQATKRLSVKEVADLEQLEVPFLSEVYISEADFWSVIVEVETQFNDRKTWLKEQLLTKSQQIFGGPGGTTQL